MLHDGLGFGFGSGFMWLFWILLIVLIALIVRAMQGSGDNSPDSQKSAMEILKERYAKGEIDRNEFEQKRKDLAE